MESRPVVAVAISAALLGCGGTTIIDGGGAGAASGGASASSGGGDAAGGGVADPCVRGPYRACALEGMCPQEACPEGCAGFVEFLEAGLTSLCGSTAAVQVLTDRFCWESFEYDLCVQAIQLYAVVAVPVDVAELLVQVGAGDQVFYTDASGYTGDPLPEPSGCPAHEGLSLCGGGCGGCGPETVCRGRSPRHPYGVCLPKEPAFCGSNTKMSPGAACFTFEVDAIDQPVADFNGNAVDAAACEAALPTYPGGAKCTYGD